MSGATVRVEVSVAVDQQRAYIAFVDEISDWWPDSVTPSVHPVDPPRLVSLERPGGNDRSPPVEVRFASVTDDLTTVIVEDRAPDGPGHVPASETRARWWAVLGAYADAVRGQLL